MAASMNVIASVLFEILQDAAMNLITEVLHGAFALLQYDRRRVVRQLALRLRVAETYKLDMISPLYAGYTSIQ